MDAIARPKTVAAAIKDCPRNEYPNIFTLLQLVCTLPATSCECERSASTLKRLYTYMRASMGQNRLTNLALMHINYELTFDYDTIIKLYCDKHSRRMQLTLRLLLNHNCFTKL